MSVPMPKLLGAIKHVFNAVAPGISRSLLGRGLLSAIEEVWTSAWQATASSSRSNFLFKSTQNRLVSALLGIGPLQVGLAFTISGSDGYRTMLTRWAFIDIYLLSTQPQIPIPD